MVGCPKVLIIESSVARGAEKSCTEKDFQGDATSFEDVFLANVITKASRRSTSSDFIAAFTESLSQGNTDLETLIHQVRTKFEDSEVKMACLSTLRKILFISGGNRHVLINEMHKMGITTNRPN